MDIRIASASAHATATTRLLGLALLALALVACERSSAEQDTTAAHPTPPATVTANTPANATPDDREVILLANREGQQVVFIDPTTLVTLGALLLPADAERAGVTNGGETLLVNMNRTLSGSGGCCELRAVDLDTLTLSDAIEWPSLSHTVTPNHRHVLTQRGNVGVEVKDGASLEHVVTIDAPGGYRFSPAPASRWVAGLSAHIRGGAVAFFDMHALELSREFPPGQGYPHLERECVLA